MRLLRQWANVDDITFLYLSLLNKSFQYQTGSLYRWKEITRMIDNTVLLKCRWYCRAGALCEWEIHKTCVFHSPVYIFVHS
jgi:hypothetical protein